MVFNLATAALGLMSFSARNAFRTVARSTPRVRPQAHTRRFASDAPAEIFDLKPAPGPGLEKLLEAERDLVHHAARAYLYIFL